MTIRHADIIPLIGGMTIGSEMALGGPPDYLMSFSPFYGNDKHILNHYGHSVPYIVLDQGGRHPSQVDVVSSTCPCAGLSMLHPHFSADNTVNDWMYRSAEYVLGEVKPLVYWGENAPNLAGNVGKPVRDRLREIAREHGYSMSLYKTQSLLHGVPQVRVRAFYFFWRGDRVPLLRYFSEPHQPVEDMIQSVSSNFQREPINPKTPSKDDPWYRYILEEIHGGRTHAEHAKLVETRAVRGLDTFSYIERRGIRYDTGVRPWMLEHGYEREAAACLRKQAKLDAGGAIMRRGTIIPRDYIGAFVGPYPHMLTHPVEDRYIDYREAMTIMGLPQDFELVGANPKNANHICQNVPVKTAYDMAMEVRAVLEDRREWIDRPFMIQFNGQRREEFADGAEATLEAFI